MSCLPAVSHGVQWYIVSMPVTWFWACVLVVLNLHDDGTLPSYFQAAVICADLEDNGANLDLDDNEDDDLDSQDLQEESDPEDDMQEDDIQDANDDGMGIFRSALDHSARPLITEADQQ